jgi:hypothetical protein
VLGFPVLFLAKLLHRHVDKSFDILYAEGADAFGYHHLGLHVPNPHVGFIHLVHLLPLLGAQFHNQTFV